MRTVFEFRPSSNCPPRDWREKVPQGFVLSPIDAELATALDADLTSALGHSWFKTAWGGIPEFLSGGFGFVMVNVGDEGPRLASNCRQWGAPGDLAPIQVSTRAHFRHKGFATLVCAAFIEECERRGLTPEYSCDSENLASAALAIKLGFVATGNRKE